jgi:LuxR family maltose regulon positive regulatory protein
VRTKGRKAAARSVGPPPPARGARLFQTKLRPPDVRGPTLARAAFPARDALAGARLVLVTAPAGFGKTTAICQYERALREASVATAWITLDSDDNDLARFTAYLRAAIERCVPQAAWARDAGSPGDRGAVIGEAFDLIDSVASSDRPLAIFLDDFEKLSDPEVRGLVVRLLLTLGPGQQLVIGSREVPDIGLARLRANGQLAEIGHEKLRFTAEETRRFVLEIRDCDMSADDVAFLHARTEGWPAALQLAVLALGDSPERTGRLREFGGSLAEVADYLAAEVLARLPDDLREFAVKISILETFCAELCEEVTGMPGGAAFIERVARANLFLVSLDAERRWFRFHALCGEYLRNQLERTQRALVPQLQRRAARWLARDGRHAAAIEQALACGDAALAAEIMDQCAVRFLHEGRITTLVRWSQAIAPERLAERPALHFIAAMASVVSHRYDDAQRLIELLDAAIGTQPDARRRDLVMLRFNLAIWSDRLQGLRPALDQAVKLYSPSDGFVYSSMLNCLGYLGFVEGGAEMGRAALAAAKASPHHRDNEVVRTYTEGQAAMVHLVRGELRDAREVAAAEFDRLAAAGSRYGTSGAIVAIVLADAHYERNELAAARVLLDEHLDLAEDSCIPDLIIAGFLQRARIARMEGEPQRADELAGRLQRTGEQRGLPRLVASALLEKSRIALAEGRVETAAAHVRDASAHAFWGMPAFRGTFGNDLESPESGQARLELFRGGTGAIAPLEAHIRAAEGAGRVRRAVKLRGLLAQALWLSGQRGPAMRELTRSLAAASPEGLVRVLADEPWVLGDMLANEGVHAHPALGSFARRVAEACGPSLAAPRGALAKDVAREILSRRELEVLAMLARGLTNKQMARELSRSEATIATHLRRIYERLGAHTRTQAIAIARRGGLID